MASLQDTAKSYLASKYGGSWTIQVEAVTAENQSQYTTAVGPSCDLTSLFKKGAAGTEGYIDVMPQVGWQVVYGSSGSSSDQDWKILYWNPSSQKLMDLDTEYCNPGGTGSFGVPWWVWAGVGFLGLMLLKGR